MVLQDNQGSQRRELELGGGGVKDKKEGQESKNYTQTETHKTTPQVPTLELVCPFVSLPLEGKSHTIGIDWGLGQAIDLDQGHCRVGICVCVCVCVEGVWRCSA